MLDEFPGTNQHTIIPRQVPLIHSRLENLMANIKVPPQRAWRHLFKKRTSHDLRKVLYFLCQCGVKWQACTGLECLRWGGGGGAGRSVGQPWARRPNTLILSYPWTADGWPTLLPASIPPPRFITLSTLAGLLWKLHQLPPTPPWPKDENVPRHLCLWVLKEEERGVQGW